MAERIVGQVGFADGFVSGRGETMLDRIAGTVDWGPVGALVGRRGGAGPGWLSYSGLVLLRCLLLGIWHDLSDPALEHAIADRLSFRRFAGLSLHDQVPDHSTLWRFRSELAKDGLLERVFEEVVRQFDAKRLSVKRGTWIDASLVAAAARPPPKATHEPPHCTPKSPPDADPRWGRKGHKSVFGYKIHIGVDQDHTIVRRVELTNASVTDTEPADALISGDEEAVYGDQAYYTHARHARLTAAGIKDRLIDRKSTRLNSSHT